MAMSAGHACHHRSAGTKHLDFCRNSPGIHSSSCSSHKPGPSSLRLIWKSVCFRVSVRQPCYLRTHWLSSGSGTLTSFWVACQSCLLRCRTLAKDPHFAFQPGECWLTVNFIRPAKGRTKPPSTQTMPLRLSPESLVRLELLSAAPEQQGGLWSVCRCYGIQPRVMPAHM